MTDTVVNTIQVEHSYCRQCLAKRHKNTLIIIVTIVSPGYNRYEVTDGKSHINRQVGAIIHQKLLIKFNANISRRFFKLDHILKDTQSPDCPQNFGNIQKCNGYVFKQS